MQCFGDEYERGAVVAVSLSVYSIVYSFFLLSSSFCFRSLCRGDSEI